MTKINLYRDDNNNDSDKNGANFTICSNKKHLKS